MASLVQKLAAQSLKTFSLSRRHAEFHQNLLHLKEMANKMTAKDLRFDERLVQNQEKFRPSFDSAPVTYVHIWEDDTFSMGIFVLKNGSRLPLHDHPEMFGVIKVIHGNMCVKSYSVRPNVTVPPEIKQIATQPELAPLVLPASLTSDTVVDVNCPPCILSPEDNNLHEIRAVGGPSAFLDILSPPYDHGSGGRICHYFEVLPGSACGDAAESSEHSSYLAQISQPLDFWCSSADYQGPDPDPYEDSS